MRVSFSIRTLLAGTTVIALLIMIPYWIPKQQPLSINEQYYTGYYRGLGFTYSAGYFGRNWYRVVVDEGEFGFWEVDVKGLGFNPYRGFYRSGRLRESGLCLVAENGIGDIAPDRHQVLHGRYFDPEGRLISEVRNGSGKQVLCSEDGRVHWELDLIDGRYHHVRRWHSNGQLALDESYRGGAQHGLSIGYFANGQLRYRGVYEDGEKVGEWLWFNADGSPDVR